MTTQRIAFLITVVFTSVRHFCGRHCVIFWLIPDDLWLMAAWAGKMMTAAWHEMGSLFRPRSSSQKFPAQIRSNHLKKGHKCPNLAFIL